MSDETIEINFSKPLPVFPLPGCVLLPHAALPLHIFEERYRKMTKDAIDSHGLIAMGLFDGQVTQHEYNFGKPPIRKHVCVGCIEQYKPMDDGQYMLMLRGLCRAKVLREEPHEPYRMFYLEPTDLEQNGGEPLEIERRRIEQLLTDPMMGSMPAVRDLEPLLKQNVPIHALVDIVAMHVCDDPELRYPMLAENNLERRCVALTAHLEGLRRNIIV